MLFFIIIKHNSKRIKKKNFKILGKLPLWEHLIKSLKNQKVFIDTDSDKIIKICNKKYKWVTAYKRKNIY